MIYIYNKNDNDYFNFNAKNKAFLNKKFAIIRRNDCPSCGLFSFYLVNLGCIKKYLFDGYIPIVDLQSFKNVYNGYNISLIKKYAKNISYLICSSHFYRPDELNIYYQNYSISFWHDFAKKYVPVKNEIILESKDIMIKLFNNSKNILWVKLRGTDYLYLRLKSHPIPPKVEIVISDVKEMDNRFKYDFIFFATEDELIKQRFVPHFKEKVKLLNYNDVIVYDKKSLITLNKKIIGNVNYAKNYLLNILVLSQCLDFVGSRGSGSAGIFIFTKGFRNTKIY